jgi:predicted RNase H-like HicB family nuclease
MASPLGELAGVALNRQADSEFWAVGSAKLAGPEAVTAGVKLFSLTASIRDRLTSDTAFEFNGVPEASAIRAWFSTLADAKIEGNVVHVRMSKDADETGQSFGQIAVSPLGQRLGALIKSARYLPVRDTATTVHTKPVIYGLDDGPRHLERYTQEGRIEMTARRYPIVIEQTGTGYSAYSPDVSGCVAVGDTEHETRRNFQEALVAHFEAMREVGEPIPEPHTSVDYVEVAA